MKIIHFGDIHVWRAKMAWKDPFYAKRYIGGLNLLMNRMKRFPLDLGETIVEEILKRDADVVVFSGDMSTASHKDEFAACAELFKPLHEKWGERFFVIPGNHDRYTRKSTKEDWYGEAFPYGKIDVVRSLDIGEDKVVVGVDCSRAFQFRSNGMFDERIGELLRAELELHKGKQVILVSHYPVDYPESVEIHWQHELINRHLLREILEEYKPSLYLHGHKHIRWRLGNAVNCGSAGMTSADPFKQAGFVEIELAQQIERVIACHVNKEKIIIEKSFDQDF